MTPVRAGIAIFLALLMTGCVQQARKPYQAVSPKIEPFTPIVHNDDPARSGSQNFKSRLDIDLFSCELIASSGYRMLTLVGMDAAEKYSQNLKDCFAYSYKDADSAFEKLNKTKRSMSVAEADKKLYASWLSYMQSLNNFAPINQALKADYQRAKSALDVELKMQDAP